MTRAFENPTTVTFRTQKSPSTFTFLFKRWQIFKGFWSGLLIIKRKDVIDFKKRVINDLKKCEISMTPFVF
jgi:hypothetical protein